MTSPAAPCPKAGFTLDDVTVVLGGRRVLESASLVVAPGEAVAFVGPSGAGKTTLIRALNGMVRVESGRVAFGDKDLASLRPGELRSARACIGLVPQDLALVPTLRVIQNVISGRLGRRSLWHSVRSMVAPTAEDQAEAHALLERVGIPEKLFERTDRLSGGQRQRVAIARALFQNPTALLADEPVSSVDPARARETVRLLAEISKERALTLCVSLHNLALAQEFFPRIVALRRGRIAFDRPTENVDREDFETLYQLDRDEILADGA